MSTYKVIEVAPDGTLRPSVRELVEPAPGQVRIRVEACGICHTDTFSVQPHQAGAGDRVPGHEVVGVINAAGAGVAGWPAGRARSRAPRRADWQRPGSRKP
ncbi:MAG TPA: alcohol dehydrogenase catalytic domain-containing protein [Trebonia sp.]|nr:alcohol dehydrogenase catalytic domain-containing protein [Trebonia sp.]